MLMVYNKSWVDFIFLSPPSGTNFLTFLKFFVLKGCFGDDLGVYKVELSPLACLARIALECNLPLRLLLPLLILLKVYGIGNYSVFTISDY